MKKIFVMGSLNMDISIDTEIFPKEGETVIGKGFITNPGGKGANQAVAAAKQGGKVIMLGAVGNDFYGKKLIESLKEYNVDTSFIKEKDTSSGVAVIILNNGKNRIILNSGANFQYNYEDYKDILIKEAREGDFFVVQLETRADNVISAITIAKQLKLKIILNPAPAVDLPISIYNKIDMILPNESEAESITGIMPDSDENILAIMKKFSKMGVLQTIITLGNKGSVYYEDGLRYVPIVEVPVVDTTGAGDAFIGSLIVELANGKQIEQAMQYATICSAITVSRYGAQQAIPYRKEIEEFYT